METYSRLSPEDISLKDSEDQSEVYIKESNTHDLETAKDVLQKYAEKVFGIEHDFGDEINTGINIMKESMILQVLEQKGVKGVPHVKRTSSGLPYSQSGFVTKNAKGSGYMFSSIGIEQVEGNNWAEHKFNSEEELIEASIKAAKILKDIYDAGFVHNDIKPSNLMIDEQGSVTVIDFNAAARHDNVSLSYSRAVSPRYAAPERLEAKTSQYNVLGDIYSFTATMAECAGVNIGILNDENLAPEIRLPKFHQELEQKMREKVISEKMSVFIMWNTSKDRVARDNNFDELLETLNMLKDPNVKTQDLFFHLRDAAEKRDNRD